MPIIVFFRHGISHAPPNGLWALSVLHTTELVDPVIALLKKIPQIYTAEDYEAAQTAAVICELTEQKAFFTDTALNSKTDDNATILFAKKLIALAEPIICVTHRARVSKIINALAKTSGKKPYLAGQNKRGKKPAFPRRIMELIVRPRAIAVNTDTMACQIIFAR
jgi:hypothetical protein